MHSVKEDSDTITDPFVSKEVDDGIVDGAGLGEVHRHGGHQGWDVDLWIHNYNHRDGGVRQPADEEGDDHGQDHPDHVFIVLQAVLPPLKFNAFVDLSHGHEDVAVAVHNDSGGQYEAHERVEDEVTVVVPGSLLPA